MFFKEKYREVLFMFYKTRVENFCKSINEYIKENNPLYISEGVSPKLVSFLEKEMRIFKEDEDTFFNHRLIHIQDICQHWGYRVPVTILPKSIKNHITALVYIDTVKLIRDIAIEIMKLDSDISQSDFFNYLGQIAESVRSLDKNNLDVSDFCIQKTMYIGQEIDGLLQDKENVYLLDLNTDFDKLGREKYLEYIENLLFKWAILSGTYRDLNPLNIKILIPVTYCNDISCHIPMYKFYHCDRGYKNGLITKSDFYGDYFDVRYEDIQEIEEEYMSELRGVFFELFLQYMINLETGVSQEIIDNILTKYFKNNKE